MSFKTPLMTAYLQAGHGRKYPKYLQSSLHMTITSVEYLFQRSRQLSLEEISWDDFAKNSENLLYHPLPSLMYAANVKFEDKHLGLAILRSIHEDLGMYEDEPLIKDSRRLKVDANFIANATGMDLIKCPSSVLPEYNNKFNVCSSDVLYIEREVFANELKEMCDLPRMEELLHQQSKLQHKKDLSIAALS